MTASIEPPLSDEALIAAFESTELPADRFTHAAHVRVAWYYLRSSPMLDAILRFSRSLRRFAESKGVTTKYHETVTVAYLLIIRDRLEGARELTWPEFAERNPDLFERSPSALARYYSDSLLASDRAREVFVLPDLP